MIAYTKLSCMTCGEKLLETKQGLVCPAETVASLRVARPSAVSPPSEFEIRMHVARHIACLFHEPLIDYGRPHRAHQVAKLFPELVEYHSSMEMSLHKVARMCTCAKHGDA